MATVDEHRDELDGLPVRWLSSPQPSGTTILYLHGVPNSADMWREELARTGGLAVDLPGFGESGKAATLDYSIAGYAAFLESFLDARGLDRVSLVMHDWGAVGLAFAQRRPAAVSRIVLICCVPLLPGYRWHRLARAWRTPLLGELVMGSSTPAVLRFFSRAATPAPGPLPDSFLDLINRHFDHGTQRAILKLYRASPPQTLAEPAARLGEIEAPALIVGAEHDPYIPASFAERYAAALGGPADVVRLEDAGHWPWLERPDLDERVAAFLAAG